MREYFQSYSGVHAWNNKMRCYFMLVPLFYWMVCTVPTDKVIITLFVLILLLGLYAVWMLAVLLTFLRYMLPPSSGLKWVHVYADFGPTGREGGSKEGWCPVSANGIIIKTALFGATDCTNRLTANSAPKQSPIRVLTGSCWGIPLHPSMPHLTQRSLRALATCFHAGFLLSLFFSPEDGSDMLLRNVGWLSTDYTALYPRRWYSS
jgi:hypothetical protein